MIGVGQLEDDDVNAEKAKIMVSMIDSKSTAIQMNHYDLKAGKKLPPKVSAGVDASISRLETAKIELRTAVIKNEIGKKLKGKMVEAAKALNDAIMHSGNLDAFSKIKGI